jgi:signal peptidase I
MTTTSTPRRRSTPSSASMARRRQVRTGSVTPTPTPAAPQDASSMATASTTDAATESRAALRADRLLRAARRLTELALVVVIALGLSTVVLGRILPATGHPVLIVAGPSMEPALPLGSAIVLERVDPTLLVVGDIVTLRTGPSQAVFTHRITRVVERDGIPWIETRGDANAEVDPSLTSSASVMGRVAVSLPVAGYLLTLASSPIGVVFALSLGGMLLVAGWLLDDVAAARARRRRTAAAPAIRGRRRMGITPPTVDAR